MPLGGEKIRRHIKLAGGGVRGQGPAWEYRCETLPISLSRSFFFSPQGKGSDKKIVKSTKTGRISRKKGAEGARLQQTRDEMLLKRVFY